MVPTEGEPSPGQTIIVYSAELAQRTSPVHPSLVPAPLPSHMRACMVLCSLGYRTSPLSSPQKLARHSRWQTWLQDGLTECFHQFSGGVVGPAFCGTLSVVGCVALLEQLAELFRRHIALQLSVQAVLKSILGVPGRAHGPFDAQSWPGKSLAAQAPCRSPREVCMLVHIPQSLKCDDRGKTVNEMENDISGPA